MTHAFFKSLLFLAAGSVIIALHHEQDIRKMGGLRHYMPVTYIAALIGSLSLIGFPGFAGFFSKDALIEAVAHSSNLGSEFAYYCILIGVFITALYTFRFLFVVFHGDSKYQGDNQIKESSWVILIPLILLSIPSIMIAWPTLGILVFGDFFSYSIQQTSSYELFGYKYQSPFKFLMHAFSGPVIYLSFIGIITAWVCYVKKPQLPEKISNQFAILHKILVNKYYFDHFYEKVIAKNIAKLGSVFWNFGDIKIIDNFFVNGTAIKIQKLSTISKRIQSGYIYHYALMMVIGLSLFLAWIIIN